MNYTKEQVTKLLSRNDDALMRALRTINRVCGWSPNEYRFATSLLSQMDDWENTPESERKYPRPLSAPQLDAAFKLVNPYAAVLARVANDNVSQPAPVVEQTPPPPPSDWFETEEEFEAMGAEMAATAEMALDDDNPF